jgi:hypothetical protein
MSSKQCECDDDRYGVQAAYGDETVSRPPAMNAKSKYACKKRILSEGGNNHRSGVAGETDCNDSPRKPQR